jgi:hypothetical protein
LLATDAAATGLGAAGTAATLGTTAAATDAALGGGAGLLDAGLTGTGAALGSTAAATDAALGGGAAALGGGTDALSSAAPSVFLGAADQTPVDLSGSAITGGGLSYGPPELVGASGLPDTGAATAISGPPELVGPTGAPVESASTNATGGLTWSQIGGYLKDANKVISPTVTAANAAGKLAGGSSTPGPSTTFNPGKPGSPTNRGDLAAVVQQMLQRRNQLITAQQQQSGKPILYQPGLLGL